MSPDLLVQSVSTECVNIALSPGHSKIFFPRLRDKIWEWPGDEAMSTALHSCFCVPQTLYKPLVGVG